MNEEIDVQYARERRITTIVGLFTVLAVVIALMGVFGIVLFEAQHRRREVAVRKVMGASTAEVLRLFNRRYARLVAVCFVIAAPVGYWAVDRWLASFAYRMPIRWWIFVAAFAVVLADNGKEPTDHALRDISAVASDLEAWGRPLLVIFASESDWEKFREDRYRLPATVSYGIDTDGSMRRMIMDGMSMSGDGRLPLIVVADTFNRVVFFSQGYSVGTGERLKRVISSL